MQERRVYCTIDDRLCVNDGKCDSMWVPRALTSTLHSKHSLSLLTSDVTVVANCVCAPAPSVSRDGTRAELPINP